jgi:hypothetical protein
MIVVGVNSSLTVNRMSLVYNVLSSGNVALIQTMEISANITLNNCTFTVNGTSAVVPQSLINHSGGRIYITQSSFNDIALSSQSLITFAGMFYLFIFIII